MTLAPGTRLGSYEILGPLGAGGMGEVYRAKDSKLKRDVAIKALPQSLAKDPDALARFEREALAVAALSHPNILSIFDFGMQDGVSYAVTELLEGKTLRGKLDEGPISLKQVVDYALQAAKGLSAAHGRGIVQRDLKPENLFVTKDGHLKILDFGLAKQMEPSSDTIAAILKEEPPELSDSGRNIPPALDHAVKHCLEKDRDNRFQSAKDIVFALSEASGQTMASGPQIAAPATGGAKTLVAAAIIVVLAVAGVLLLWRTHRGAGSAGGVKRIAVLPFENLGSPDDAWPSLQRACDCA